MNFCKLPILILLLAGMFCGCVSGDNGITEKDKLTDLEKGIVVSHVRRFVMRSRKIKLTEAERQRIQKENPVMNIRYTGHKTGQLSIRWQLPNYRLLLLQRSGNLLSSERADWIVRIISDQASGKIPQNFYGAHGEDISLPPK